MPTASQLSGQTSGPGGDVGVNTPQAGVPGGQSNFVQDPVSGLWMDPSSKNVYQLLNGQYVPVHDLNAASQVAKNIATSDYYKNLATTNSTAFAGAVAGQSSLADAYRTTIQDPNAPSVAREQLNQALGATDATQDALASGASGENANIARTNAANNIAGANAQEGQSAALLRAQETAAAQQGLGQTLGSVANEENTAYGANTGLGSAYAQLAANSETAGNQIKSSADTAKDTLAVTTVAPAAASGASGALSPSSSGGGASTDAGAAAAA